MEQYEMAGALARAKCLDLTQIHMKQDIIYQFFVDSKIEFGATGKYVGTIESWVNSSMPDNV
jgi:hypothetical protein